MINHFEGIPFMYISNTYAGFAIWFFCITALISNLVFWSCQVLVLALSAVSGAIIGHESYVDSRIIE